MRRAGVLLLALLLVASPAAAQELLGVGHAGPATDTRATTAARFSGEDPARAYPARLAAIREVARRYPGRIANVGHQYREMGLVAGIYMQTQWQHESGRDELPIWFLVNEMLTLAPYAYMQEYQANPGLPCEQSPYALAHPTRSAAVAPIHIEDACRTWKDYFRACDDVKRDLSSKNPLVRLRGAWNQRTVVNRKLWRAHTTAIRFALWQYRDEFAGVDVPEPELAFWRGWIKVVFLSEKISPSTTDLLLKPFLTLAMPPCSPLGASSCSASEQPPLRSAFLAWLMRGKVDQQEFLLVFGGRPAAPPGGRLAAVVLSPVMAETTPDLAPLREPALAAAVSSGLRADAIAIDPGVDELLDAVVTRVRRARP
jgi:hypothetical protein